MKLSDVIGAGIIILLALFVTVMSENYFFDHKIAKTPIAEVELITEQVSKQEDDFDELSRQVEEDLRYIENRLDVLERELQTIQEELDQYRIDFTLEELQHLLSLVEHEAGAESMDCKLWVASIIINRVNDERYPDNLWDVIYQTDPTVQFSPVIDGLYKEPSETTRIAVREALRHDYTDGCWIFNNRSLTAPSLQKWFDKFELVAEFDDVQFRR